MRGRKKRTYVDLLRTQVWIFELLRVSGLQNINQLGDLIDDVETKKLLYRYASGEISISKPKLEEIHIKIEQLRPNLEDARKFFAIGPASTRHPDRLVHLWDALEGSIEEASAAMVKLDPAIGLQKYDGVPFLTRCIYLIYPIFNDCSPPPYWDNREQKNFVAERYKNGELEIDIELITFAIAAWRMANFIGEQQRLMNYTMIGLLDRAIPETVDRLYGIIPEKSGYSAPYTVSDKLIGALKDLAIKDVEDAEEAAIDLNYFTPKHTFHDKQEHDYRFIAEHVRRSSMYEYLEHVTNLVTVRQQPL